MPGYDRTGPNGGGPMTGRGAGYCPGNNSPGYFTGMPRAELRGRGLRRGGAGRYNPRGELRPRYQQTQAPKTQISEKSTSERIVGLLEKIVDAKIKK